MQQNSGCGSTGDAGHQNLPAEAREEGEAPLDFLLDLNKKSSHVQETQIFSHLLTRFLRFFFENESRSLLEKRNITSYSLISTYFGTYIGTYFPVIDPLN